MSTSSTLPDQAWIAARIPHRGSMCLLDSVLRWDDNSIVCQASSHQDADNPLRSDGQLGMANGIEYAAQAMAVHGALLAGSETAPAAGFLASVRDVKWQAPRLDTKAAELQIHAQRLSGDGNTILYSFHLEAGGSTLLSGRASVMLDAGAS
ncbi:MAG: hydroxymyristoyl-ACP dehydratase [Hylemonella sp.]|nr:hydroxymyristoyl-ACP dehydratase [Hylemonella sp.]